MRGIAGLGALVLCVALGAAAPAPSGGAARYLYVVGCDGVVDKIDTVSARTLKSLDLAKIFPIKRDQTVAGATFDGCLMNQAVYVPTIRAFFSVVPDQFSDKPGGTKDYHVFRVSIPGLQAKPAFAAGADQAEAPRIELAGADGVRVETEPSAAGEPALSTIAGSGSPPLRGQSLASSGGRTLVRLFASGAPKLVLAVVDLRKGALIRLQDLPRTTSRFAHLGPGGTRVYVEEEAAAPGVRTGRMFVYDASTGARLNVLADARVAAMAFLVVSPNGKAIYRGGERYRFLDVGGPFPTDPVTSPNFRDAPALFFADR